MTYEYKYRRYFGQGKFSKWEVLKDVTGHKLLENDILQIYFRDGGIRTIVAYGECEVQLGVDWVLAVKESMEKEAGQDIKLKPGIGEKQTGS